MRRGFTLIELLVVITIVLVVAGLLMVGGQMAMKQARQAGTVQRIQGVTRGLSQLGQVEGSAAYVVQKRLAQADPALGGAVLVDYPNDRLDVTEGQWLDYDQPFHLRFPWGQHPIIYTGSGTSDRSQPPQPFGLSQMNVAQSQVLLELVELLPPAAPERYLDDRNPDQPWNDSWGHPLIVAYALYQYGPDPAASNESQPPSMGFNWQWKLAKETFGHTRSVYLAVGSGGPRLSVPPNDLTGIWNQLNAVANRAPDGGDLWRVDASVNAMSEPPWSGIRVEQAERQLGLISTPLEIR